MAGGVEAWLWWKAKEQGIWVGAERKERRGLIRRRSVEKVAQAESGYERR